MEACFFPFSFLCLTKAKVKCSLCLSLSAGKLFLFVFYFFYQAISANISEFDRAENRLNFSEHGTVLNFPS